MDDNMKTKEIKMVTKKVEWWLRRLGPASQIATIISCIIMLLIYFKISVLVSPSGLILTPSFGTETGEISLTIYNTNGFIHNGTIYLTLLENGIYKVDELHEHTGILSHRAGHTYKLKFDSLRIKPRTDYTVQIRVEADGRLSTSTIEGQWD